MRDEQWRVVLRRHLAAIEIETDCDVIGITNMSVIWTEAADAAIAEMRRDGIDHPSKLWLLNAACDETHGTHYTD